MKTLFVLPDLFRAEGGIARIMRLYLRAAGQLAQPGDQIDYVALMDRGDTTAAARALIGPALRHVKNSAGERLLFAAQIWRSALSADQVICAHVHHLVLVWLISLLRPSLRYYVVAHGIEVWRPFRFWERLALRRATRVLCISEYTRQQVRRFARGLDERRLLIVPNTFDPRLSEGDQPVPIAAQPAPLRILTVSRIVSTDPYKGVDLMIEAMPAILAQFPDACLRVVGGGDDLPRHMQLAASLGVARSVDFLGIVSDAELRAEYAACTLFALPSRKEGFGLVYLEAMAWGKPCLAAKAGGAPEVVGDTDPAATTAYAPLGESGATPYGALVEYGHVADIATATAELVRNPRDPARIRARAAEYSFANFVPRVRAALAVSR